MPVYYRWRPSQLIVTSLRGRARHARVSPAFACCGEIEASLRGSRATLPACRWLMQAPDFPLAEA